MEAAGNWSTHQLTELLALLSACSTPREASQVTIERAAEALEAEVGALVAGDRVIVSVGFPAGKAPEGDLVEAAAGRRTALDVPGMGRSNVAAAPLERGSPHSLLVARTGDEPFSREEASLLRGMAAVLALTHKMQGLVADERVLRRASERQAQENARLVDSLEERRRLIEALTRVQRSITQRHRLQDVLDAIVGGARELLGADMSAVRLVDGEDPTMSMTVSSEGVGSELGRRMRRVPVGDGVGGRAIAEGRPIVVDDYRSAVGMLDSYRQAGVRVAMAVPLHEHAAVVGSLVVALCDTERTFTAPERDSLVAFAEQASVALTAARTADTMRQAFNDSLTGLANRALFLDRLDHALARAERSRIPAQVLFIDLDGFKLVNDSLGHAAGDEVLVAVADRLRSVLRRAETVARLGGDEFAVLLEDSPDARAVGLVAESLLAVLATPFTTSGREVFLSASIGIASGLGPPEELLRNADLAMYRAKRRGKGLYEIFELGMHVEVVERLSLEGDLRRALARNELFLHYQPIISLETGQIAAVEAVVRWRHPERGMVSPASFIPLAEETGLVLPVGRWVLAEAARQMARWHEEVPGAAGLEIAVNLSVPELTDPELVSRVAAALESSGLDPRTLTLELTETGLMQDIGASVERLGGLKALGLRLAVDDFGTGHSSLRYLHTLPIDILKIDKLFVDALATGGGDATVAKAIADLGRNLRLDTVAEGIEYPEQVARLREIGCRLGQGFLFHRPLDAEAMTELLAKSGGGVSAEAVAGVR